MPQAEENVTEVFLELIGKGEGISMGSHMIEKRIHSTCSRSTYASGLDHQETSFLLMEPISTAQGRKVNTRVTPAYNSLAFSVALHFLLPEGRRFSWRLAGTKTPTGPPRKAIWSSRTEQRLGEGENPSVPNDVQYPTRRRQKQKVTLKVLGGSIFLERTHVFSWIVGQCLTISFSYFLILIFGI